MSQQKEYLKQAEGRLLRQSYIIKHLVETINILSKQLIEAIDEKKRR